jgi:hypothetical protein
VPKYHNVDPYTQEWWKARLGIPTASQFHRIITNGGKPSAQAREYMACLVAERLLGRTSQHRSVNTEWVERGNMLEPEALLKFQQVAYNKPPYRQFILKTVGFVTTDDGRMGCSPDAMIEGSVEAVEAKCPSDHVHMGYLLDGPGNDYKAQVQGQLLVGGWDKVHFFSYHPRMPYCWREIGRDKKYLALLKPMMDEFCDELDRMTALARTLGNYKEWEPKDELDIPDPSDFPWRKTNESR